MAQWLNFEGANRVLTAPEGHEADIEPLHAHTDGVVTTILCHLSIDEIQGLLENGGRLWIQQLSGDTIHPIRVMVSDRMPEV